MCFRPEISKSRLRGQIGFAAERFIGAEPHPFLSVVAFALRQRAEYDLKSRNVHSVGLWACQPLLLCGD